MVELKCYELFTFLKFQFYKNILKFKSKIVNKKVKTELKITNMSEEILAHLMARPIASIVKLQNSESEEALKLMTVIDFMLEKSQLYAEILQYPKLLEQLLRFKSYDRFHYFEYKMKKVPFGQCLLICQCCEFTAPYATTLEHMVLNHGRHLSGEQCQWCQKSGIREHIDSNTLKQCYCDYADLNQIKVNSHVIRLIGDVFSQLRLLAVNLGVRTTRQASYRACISTGVETIVSDDIVDDELSSEVVVTKPVVRNKSIKSAQLEKLFQEAMRFFVKDAEPIRYSPFQMCDQSVPPMQQMPPIQQMQQMQPMQHPPPQHQQQQHQPQVQNLPASIPASPQIGNLANLMTCALQNMQSDAIRMRAVFDIHKLVLQYSTEDLQFQLKNKNKTQ